MTFDPPKMGENQFSPNLGPSYLSDDRISSNRTPKPEIVKGERTFFSFFYLLKLVDRENVTFWPRPPLIFKSMPCQNKPCYNTNFQNPIFLISFSRTKENLIEKGKVSSLATLTWTDPFHIQDIRV